MSRSPGAAFVTGATLDPAMERIFDDTSAEAEAVMLEIYRHMPVWRKVQIIDDANRTARQLALAGLRGRQS